VAALVIAAEEGDTPAPASGGSMNWMMIIVLVGMIGLMFFMSRRNKKQQQARGDFRRLLEPGQRVQTIGGLIGVITGLQGDLVTLMSPSGDEATYTRNAIKAVVSDEEYANLTQPYPVDEEEPDGAEDAEDGSDGDSDQDLDADGQDGPEDQDDQPDGQDDESGGK
jgi:preprotein translocase subunit YajC